MAGFLTNLLQSIFTPGPTPTLVVATNASFALLQLVLLVLLATTASIHFAILSFLCGTLWFAINWFVKELESSKQSEAQSKRDAESKREQDNNSADDSDTETEDAEKSSQGPVQARITASRLSPSLMEDMLRKRRSMGEGSTGGDISTDSEWDKVEDEGDEER
ncbi:MAG: hypothetical protein MMC33_000973 [Icmadophila ericetorum]|nr:hypothetical protein [Icmadophila ericetorum]